MSASSSVPQLPLFADGLFTQHLWKAVGLMPRQFCLAPRFSLNAQSSGGRTTTSSRGNGQDAAPMSEDRERAGNAVPSTSSPAPPASAKRRRSSNNGNPTSPKAAAGKSVRGKEKVIAGCFLRQVLKFSSPVSRRQRTRRTRQPASLSSLMKHLPFELSLSPKTSDASDGPNNSNEAIAMLSPSRSSSPRDHNMVKDLPAKLNRMSSEEEETAVANMSSGTSSTGQPCSTPQANNDAVPMSVF